VWTTAVVTRMDILERLGRVALVEALGPMFYADAHLPGAVNLPPELVAELAPTLLPDRSVPVVVYASAMSPASAATVSRRLLELGFEDVAVYPGGKEDWVEAGLPVHRGPGP
jgi:rhodanese-related sulfurtransferase